MNHLKKFKTFENLNSEDEGLQILGDISDIFSQVEDDFGMDLDYHLTSIHNPSNTDDITPHGGYGKFSYDTYKISGDLDDSGELSWDVGEIYGQEVPKSIFTIVGSGDIRFSEILNFSKSLESSITRTISALGIKLLKRQFWNSFGDNRISISSFSEPFRLEKWGSKFYWESKVVKGGAFDETNILHYWVKDVKIDKSKLERVNFRLDFYLV